MITILKDVVCEEDRGLLGHTPSQAAVDICEKWNDGYWTEGLDRCHTVMVMLEELLVGHQAVARAGCEKQIDNALFEIMEAYQTMGSQAFEEEEKND